MPKQQSRRAKQASKSRVPSIEIVRAAEMANSVFADLVPIVTLTQSQLSNVLARAFQAGWRAHEEKANQDAYEL